MNLGWPCAKQRPYLLYYRPVLCFHLSLLYGEGLVAVVFPLYRQGSLKPPLNCLLGLMYRFLFFYVCLVGLFLLCSEFIPGSAQGSLLAGLKEPYTVQSIKFGQTMCKVNALSLETIAV